MPEWKTIMERGERPDIKRLNLGPNISLELAHVESLGEWRLGIKIKTESMRRFDVSREIDLDPLDQPDDWEHMQAIAEDIAAFWLEELAGLASGAAGMLRDKNR